MERLEPCPFCYSEDTFVRTDPPRGRPIVALEDPGSISFGCCGNCGAFGPRGNSKTEAAAQWNRWLFVESNFPEVEYPRLARGWCVTDGKKTYVTQEPPETWDNYGIIAWQPLPDPTKP
jgi:hypothetical protein